VTGTVQCFDIVEQRTQHDEQRAYIDHQSQSPRYHHCLSSSSSSSWRAAPWTTGVPQVPAVKMTSQLRHLVVQLLLSRVKMAANKLRAAADITVK